MSKLDPNTFYRIPKGQWSTHKLPGQMTPAERKYAELDLAELAALGYERQVAEERQERRQQHYAQGVYNTYVWVRTNSGNSTNGW